MKPGIYSDIDIREYHQGPGVSRSVLKVLWDGTPRDLQRHLAGGTVETLPMKVGTAAHLAVFEPDKFATDVVRQPVFAGANADEQFKGKGAKERIAAWKEAHADSLAIPTADYDTALEIAHLCKTERATKHLVEGAAVEQSIFWEEDGLLLKTRPDAYIESAGLTVDLKTCPDLSDRKLQNYIMDYAADVQAAMMMRACKALGLPWNGHALIFARKPNPDVRVVSWSLRPTGKEQLHGEAPTWLEVGEARFDVLLGRYRDAMASDTFPGWGEAPTHIPVPAWASSLCSRAEEEAHARKETAA